MVEDFPLAPEEETPDFQHLANTLKFRFIRAVEHWRGQHASDLERDHCADRRGRHAGAQCAGDTHMNGTTDRPRGSLPSRTARDHQIRRIPYASKTGSTLTIGSFSAEH